jgi:hypothetical protein
MMKKEIIIHIGSGKTGSTSIQNALFENQTLFEEKMVYPVTLNKSSNQLFRCAFCELEKAPGNIKSEYKNNIAGFKTFQKNIKEDFEVKTKNSDAVIVSSEFLFSAGEQEVLDIKSYLESLGFNSFKIVVYIRNPSDYYLSLVQQSVKNNPTLPSPENFGYDFKKTIILWREIFENLKVRLFQKGFLVENDVVKDFVSVMNQFGYVLDFKNPKRVNEGLSSELAQILQDIRKQYNPKNINFDKYQLLGREVLKLIEKYASKGSKPILSYDIKDYINFRFQDDLKWLNQEYLFDLDINSGINKISKVTEFCDLVTDFNPTLYNEMRVEIDRIKELLENE